MLYTSINTMPLMITAVIQYNQELSSSAMCSFLDSGSSQALNGKSGLQEDFTKHMKTKQNQLTLQDETSVMCLIFNSKPLVAFSSCKLKISELPILPNKSWITLASLELPLLFTVSRQPPLVPIKVTQTLLWVSVRLGPCDLTFTDQRNFSNSGSTQI